MSIYYIYLLPLAFGFLSSLSTLRLDWPKPFRLFCLFLAVTLSVEVFAFFWSYSLHRTRWWHFSPNNIWLYNIYLVPQYLFYIYFFAVNIGFGWTKKVAAVLAFLYCGIALPNIIFIQKLFMVNFMTIIAANFIVIFLSITYFMQLMRAKTVIRLAGQPMFWISAGAFIFHLGSLPCFIAFGYIAAKNAVLANSLFRIILILNCIMYLMYSTAFLCTKKFPTSPSLPSS